MHAAAEAHIADHVGRDDHEGQYAGFVDFDVAEGSHPWSIRQRGLNVPNGGRSRAWDFDGGMLGAAQEAGIACLRLGQIVALASR